LKIEKLTLNCFLCFTKKKLAGQSTAAYIYC